MNSTHQIKVAVIFAAFCFFSSNNIYAQGPTFPTPPSAAAGAYINHFKYYSPAATDMPAGAGLVSDALMLMSIPVQDFPLAIETQTAFIINSYREDNKVCVCASGHGVQQWNIGQHYADIYTKYMGEYVPVPAATLYGALSSSLKSTVHFDLVAKADDDASGDWAVLLVSPDELPGGYGQLPYVFNNLLYPNTPAGKYYSMHHAWAMPQRVSDSLSYATGMFRQFSTSSPFVTLDAHPARVNPGGMGASTSGAPIMNSYLLPPAVVGIYRGTRFGLTPQVVVPQSEVPPYDLQRFNYPDNFKYSNSAVAFTKFSAPALMAAIKKHCWATKDSAAIENDTRYKTGVRQANTQQVNEFGTSRTVTSQSGLATAADQSYGESNPGAALLKASTLIISCPLATSATLQQISGLAKEVVLNSGFEYTATDSYWLDMNIVVSEPGSSTISRPVPINISRNRDTLKAENFVVYPNPSGDGVFYISFPGSAAGGHLTLSSMEGKQIYKGNMGNTNPYKLELSSLSKGTYVLNIYHPKTGEILFNKLIVYR
jgi:hypothetical protein